MVALQLRADVIRIDEIEAHADAGEEVVVTFDILALGR